MKAKVESLSQPAQPTFQQQQPSDIVRAQRVEQLNKLWEENPRQAVQTELMMMAEWMDQVNSNVDQENEALSRKYPDFNTYRGDAMKYVRSLPLGQRDRPGIVEMAYLLVRGQNVDRMLESQKTQLQQQFQTNPMMFMTPAGSFSTPPQQGGPTLTEDERKTAAVMGIKEEDYIKYKKVS